MVAGRPAAHALYRAGASALSPQRVNNLTTSNQRTLGDPAITQMPMSSACNGSRRKSARRPGTYSTRASNRRALPVTSHKARLGDRRVSMMLWCHDRLAKIRPRLATISVVKVRARASPSLCPRRRLTRKTASAIGQDDHPLQQAEPDQPTPNSRSLGLRGGRRMIASVLRLHLEHHRAGRLDDEVQERDVHRQKEQRQPEGHRRQRHPGDGNMDGQDVGHRVLEVVEHASPEAHGPHDRRKVVVEDHQRGGLAGNIGAATAHRDADVGGLRALAHR